MCREEGGGVDEIWRYLSQVLTRSGDTLRTCDTMPSACTAMPILGPCRSRGTRLCCVSHALSHPQSILSGCTELPVGAKTKLTADCRKQKENAALHVRVEPKCWHMRAEGFGARAAHDFLLDSICLARGAATGLEQSRLKHSEVSSYAHVHKSQHVLGAEKREGLCITSAHVGVVCVPYVCVPSTHISFFLDAGPSRPRGRPLSTYKQTNDHVWRLAYPGPAFQCHIRAASRHAAAQCEPHVEGD